MAILSFGNAGTADIAEQQQTKAARKVLPIALHRTALEKLVLVDAATALRDLSVWPSLKLEKLKGNRRGNTVFALTSSIGFVLSGSDGTHRMSKSSTITEA